MTPRPCRTHCDECLRHGICWTVLTRWLNHTRRSRPGGHPMTDHRSRTTR